MLSASFRCLCHEAPSLHVSRILHKCRTACNGLWRSLSDSGGGDLLHVWHGALRAPIPCVSPEFSIYLT